MIRKCAPAFSSPFTNRKPAAVNVTSRQPLKAVATDAKTMTAMFDQNRIEIEVSVRDRLLVEISRNPADRAAPNGNNNTHSNPAPPGRTITSIPKKPARTAIQRRGPIISRPRAWDKATTKIGLEKAMAVTSASGRREKLVTMNPVVETKNAARSTMPKRSFTISACHPATIRM